MGLNIESDSQGGTPAPSSSVDQLVGAILAACSASRAAHSRASGFVLWPIATVRSDSKKLETAAAFQSIRTLAEASASLAGRFI